MVDKQFRYREKHVHDLAVGDSLIRLWDVEGAVNKGMIVSAFKPLISTGFVWPYIALMPDYHPGEGSMIGSVIPTQNALLPSVIGGDIGCGMTAVQLKIPAKDLRPRLPKLYEKLRERIPVGTAHNAQVTDRVEANPIWQRNVRSPFFTNRMRRKMLHQFASLGGGNHFLELQQDQDDEAWIMLHSGSRYLGVLLRDYYIAQGQTQASVDQRLYAKVPYLPVNSPLADDYLADLRFVLDFARESRKEMMHRSLEVLAETLYEKENDSIPTLIDAAYDIAHNYVNQEEHFGEKVYVHRKGAVCLSGDRIGLIPGSMGTSSYVVQGRNNSFAFHSCSHGAGRAMSRGDAFRTISDKEFTNSMEDVFHDHNTRIKDEAPAAYKDIRHVMRSQKDLVKVVHTLQPILSIKGQS